MDERRSRSRSMPKIAYGRDGEELSEFAQASAIAQPGGFRRQFLKTQAQKHGVSPEQMPPQWREPLVKYSTTRKPGMWARWQDFRKSFVAAFDSDSDDESL